MRMPKIAILAPSLVALGLIAAPAHAYTEDKGAHLDRLLNDDGDAAVPDHFPKVFDPTSKAFDCNPAYMQDLMTRSIGAPATQVSQADDLPVLEPESEVPLNGGIKLD